MLPDTGILIADLGLVMDEEGRKEVVDGSWADTVRSLEDNEEEGVLEGNRLGCIGVGFRAVNVDVCLGNGETKGVLDVVPEFKIDGIDPENVKGLVGEALVVNTLVGVTGLTGCSGRMG